MDTSKTYIKTSEHRRKYLSLCLAIRIKRSNIRLKLELK